MTQLENAIKFLRKYYFILLPLFVAAAFPALMYGSSARNLFVEVISKIENPEQLADTEFIINAATTAAAAGTAGVLAFLLNITAIPASAGMIKKGLSGSQPTVEDIIPSLKSQFSNYIKYWIGTILAGLAFVTLFMVVAGILGVIGAALHWIAFVILVIFILALMIAGITAAILLSLWLPIMVMDGLKVVDAAKKSINIAKKQFWKILGAWLLVNVTGSIASGILGMIFGNVSVIGPVILAAIPTATGAIMLTYYFMVYVDDESPIV